MENTTLDTAIEADQHNRLALLGQVRTILGPDATSAQIQTTVQFVLTGMPALDADALDHAARVLAKEIGYHWGDRSERNKGRGIATAVITAYLTPAAQRAPINEITLAR